MVSAFQNFKRNRDAAIRLDFLAGMPMRSIETKYSVSNSVVRRALGGITRPGGEKYRRPLSDRTIALRASVIDLRLKGLCYKQISYHTGTTIGNVGDILAKAGMTRATRQPPK